MKRIIYFLVFSITFLVFLPAEARFGKHAKEGGDFIVIIKDFQLEPQSEKENKLECQPSSIEFKSEKGAQIHSMTPEQFCGLWDAGQSFNKQPPNATLAFHQKGKIYQMIFRIPEATPAENPAAISMQAITYNPQAAYTEDGRPIKKDEFLSATRGEGKENIVLMVDDDPWDPRH